MFWFLKKTYERRKRHCSILQNILENQAFQRTAKFIEMKDISKSRWDVQHFEKSANHWLLVETWRWNFKVNAFSTCLVFVRVAANHKHVICKRISEKFLRTLLLMFICLYLHITLFRMHVDIQHQRKNLIL